MMRRLCVLTFLAVGLVMLVSTPLASSERYTLECRLINECEILCCDTRTGYCLVTETGWCT